MRRKYIPITVFMVLFLNSYCFSQGAPLVNEVEFKGNKDFGSEELLKLMVTRPSSFLRKVSYYQYILDDDLTALRDFYQSMGYFESEVNLVRVENIEENRVNVYIRIKEGPPYYISNFYFFGNTVFTDNKLKQAVTIQKGEVFRRRKIVESVNSILKLYGEIGYLNSEVKTDIKLNENEKSITVNFVVTEREQHTVREIKVEGLEKTKEYVVLRYVEFEKGEVLQRSELVDTKRRLYFTGIFEEINIDIEPFAGLPSTSPYKTAVLRLAERKSIELSLSAGYSTLEKFWQRAEIRNSNLFGTGIRLGVIGRRSAVSREGSFALTEPLTFGSLWQTDLDLSADFRDKPAYNLYSYRTLLSESRKISKVSSIGFTFRYEEQEIFNTDETSIKEILRGYSLTLARDTRNNLVSPSEGSYLKTENEIVFGRELYFKTTENIKVFFSPFGRAVIGTAVKFGWISRIQQEIDIPISEKFYAGGPNSIRGFEYQMVGPKDAVGNPTGGKLLLVVNIFEFRQPVWGILSGAVFSDAGCVWDEAINFRFSDIRYSFGVGLRAGTPIGILRLDAAWNPDRKEEEDTYIFYFASGLAF